MSTLKATDSTSEADGCEVDTPDDSRFAKDMFAGHGREVLTARQEAFVAATGMRNGQERNMRSVAHNASWRANVGDSFIEIGWGDLNERDMVILANTLEPGERFLVFGEHAKRDAIITPDMAKQLRYVVFEQRVFEIRDGSVVNDQRRIEVAGLSCCWQKISAEDAMSNLIGSHTAKRWWRRKRR